MVVAVGKRAATVGEQVLEAICVELPLLDDEPVAGPFRHEPPGRQDAAELRDVQPEDARRRRRCHAALPHRLDQRVGRQRLAGAEGQRREQPPRLRSELCRRPAEERLERPENPQLESILDDGIVRLRLARRRTSTPTGVPGRRWPRRPLTHAERPLRLE